jgi:hypothetical protein
LEDPTHGPVRPANLFDRTQVMEILSMLNSVNRLVNDQQVQLVAQVYYGKDH